MTLDPASVSTLAARIRVERTHLARVVGELRNALARLDPESQDVVTTHGVGGLLHDFYTGLEKIFALIAPAMNGGFPRGEAWHRDLLHAMTLDLPGVRPPLLCGRTGSELLEYLKFRHIYRNMYGFSLKWPRVRELAAGAVGLWPDVDAQLASFLDFLDALGSCT
jgi:hypothetical protein